MKYSLCITALLLLINAASSQTNLSNTLDLSKDNNHLFLGIRNVLEITSPADSGLMLKSRFTIIERTSDPKIFHAFSSDLLPDTISIFQGSKLMYSKVFYGTKLPYPRVQWGVVTGKEAYREEILASKRMVVIVDGCKLDFGKILSYQLECIGNDGQVPGKTINVLGAELNEQATDAIQESKRGDRIRFDKIKVVSTGGLVRDFKSFEITIK